MIRYWGSRKHKVSQQKNTTKNIKIIISKLNGVNLTGLQVSDLFFNSSLDNYNNVNPKSSNYTEELAAALLKDAKEFAERLGNQVSAQELVDDFNARV